MLLTLWITTNWKTLKDGNIRPSYLPPEKSVCRSRSNSLELDMDQQTGSKLEKEYVKTVYCYPAYLYAEYIMRNSRLDEAQARIKSARRNINNLRYSDGTHL